MSSSGTGKTCSSLHSNEVNPTFPAPRDSTVQNPTVGDSPCPITTLPEPTVPFGTGNIVHPPSRSSSVNIPSGAPIVLAGGGNGSTSRVGECVGQASPVAPKKRLREASPSYAHENLHGGKLKVSDEVVDVLLADARIGRGVRSDEGGIDQLGVQQAMQEEIAGGQQDQVGNQEAGEHQVVQEPVADQGGIDQLGVQQAMQEEIAGGQQDQVGNQEAVEHQVVQETVADKGGIDQLGVQQAMQKEIAGGQQDQVGNQEAGEHQVVQEPVSDQGGIDQLGVQQAVPEEIVGGQQEAGNQEAEDLVADQAAERVYLVPDLNEPELPNLNKPELPDLNKPEYDQ